MRAVNLIPSESRRATGVQTSFSVGPGYAVLGILAVAVALVTVYVLTSNSISSRKAQLATLQGQVAQAQAAADKLAPYAKFVKLAEKRADTVRQIAASRFDWHAALGDLSQVVPANTSLQSLVGTVSPNASVTGPGGSGGGASTGSLRSSISAPAFEMKGCTKTQDDVARLMSRLRLINGVQRVTLADSLKGGSGSGGVAAGSSSSGSGCGNGPTFDLVVFFQPMAGATTAGAAGAAPGATPASTSSSATTTTTSSSTSTTSSSGGSK